MDTFLTLDGYQLCSRRDGRDTDGGRWLLIYVKDGISAAELQLTRADQVIECCGITVPWGRGGGEVIKLILVYT